MTKNKFQLKYSRKRQQGAFLLLAVLIVLVAASSISISKVDPQKIRNRQINLSRKAMAEIKMNLVAYAYNSARKNNNSAYSGRYGLLPCPDETIRGVGGEGADDGNCDYANSVELGRVPWRSIKVAALHDYAGECFWYAVSGTHKRRNNYQNSMLNEDTPGMLRVFTKNGGTMAGTKAYDRPVAAVISPGPALSLINQKRYTELGGHQVSECGGNYLASNYLEHYDLGILAGVVNNAEEDSSQANTAHDLVSGYPIDTEVNDTVLLLSRKDIFAPIMQSQAFQDDIDSLARKLAECVAGYGRKSGHNKLPWAAAFDLDDYENEYAYRDVAGATFGRLPYIVDESNSVTGMNVLNILDRAITDPDPGRSASSDLVPPQSGQDSHCLYNNQDPVIFSASDSRMYQHWKDHFFYVVAREKSPNSGVQPGCVLNNCLEVKGAQYAALIIFSGAPANDQQWTRIGPPHTTNAEDRKNVVSNYLEHGNFSNYIQVNGIGGYAKNNFSPPEGSVEYNDKIYCIKEISSNVKGYEVVYPCT